MEAIPMLQQMEEDLAAMEALDPAGVLAMVAALVEVRADSLPGIQAKTEHNLFEMIVVLIKVFLKICSTLINIFRHRKRLGQHYHIGSGRWKTNSATKHGDDWKDCPNSSRPNERLHRNCEGCY